jgi:hypothetical protein
VTGRPATALPLKDNNLSSGDARSRIRNESEATRVARIVIMPANATVVMRENPQAFLGAHNFDDTITSTFRKV